jgi:hypothetical protein
MLVIVSYVQLTSWRKHPSRLLLYRVFTNVLFSVVQTVNAIVSYYRTNTDDFENDGSCIVLSYLTQFSFFAGECWLFVISFDLVISLSNPFTSIHENLKKYRVNVLIGLLDTISFILCADACLECFNAVCTIASNK